MSAACNLGENTLMRCANPNHSLNGKMYLQSGNALREIAPEVIAAAGNPAVTNKDCTRIQACKKGTKITTLAQYKAALNSGKPACTFGNGAVVKCGKDVYVQQNGQLRYATNQGYAALGNPAAKAADCNAIAKCKRGVAVQNAAQAAPLKTLISKSKTAAKTAKPIPGAYFATNGKPACKDMANTVVKADGSDAIYYVNNEGVLRQLTPGAYALIGNPAPKMISAAKVAGCALNKNAITPQLAKDIRLPAAFEEMPSTQKNCIGTTPLGSIVKCGNDMFIMGTDGFYHYLSPDVYNYLINQSNLVKPANGAYDFQDGDGCSGPSECGKIMTPPDIQTAESWRSRFRSAPAPGSIVTQPAPPVSLASCDGTIAGWKTTWDPNVFNCHIVENGQNWYGITYHNAACADCNGNNVVGPGDPRYRGPVKQAEPPSGAGPVPGPGGAVVPGPVPVVPGPGAAAPTAPDGHVYKGYDVAKCTDVTGAGWRTKTDGTVFNCPFMWNNSLYWGRNDGNDCVPCDYDRTIRQPRWNGPGAVVPAPGPVVPGPAAAPTAPDGHVYKGYDAAKCTNVIGAGWRDKPESPVFNCPFMWNNSIYWGRYDGNDCVPCDYDRTIRQPKWSGSVPGPAQPPAQPAPVPLPPVYVAGKTDEQYCNGLPHVTNGWCPDGSMCGKDWTESARYFPCPVLIDGKKWWGKNDGFGLTTCTNCSANERRPRYTAANNPPFPGAGVVTVGKDSCNGWMGKKIDDKQSFTVAEQQSSGCSGLPLRNFTYTGTNSAIYGLIVRDGTNVQCGGTADCRGKIAV